MEPSPPRPRLRDRIAAAYPQMLLIAERVVHRRTQAAARAKVTPTEVLHEAFLELDREEEAGGQQDDAAPRVGVDVGHLPHVLHLRHVDEEALEADVEEDTSEYHDDKDFTDFLSKSEIADVL